MNLTQYLKVNKLIINYIKSFITITFFIFPTILLSNERIDLDYKYTTEDPLEFYSLSNHVSSLKTVILGGKTYTIKRLPNEVFIDTYYDTKELDLYKNGESIRFRKRYIKWDIFNFFLCSVCWNLFSKCWWSSYIICRVIFFYIFLFIYSNTFFNSIQWIR